MATPFYQLHPSITLHNVRAMLHYDRKTGDLTWKNRRSRTQADDLLAGMVERRSGHVLVTLFGQKIPAQRLVWFMTHGKWPEERLKCMDDDPQNLKLDNWMPLSLTLTTDTVQVNARERAKRWREKRRSRPARAEHLAQMEAEAEAVNARKLEQLANHQPRLHTRRTP